MFHHFSSRLSVQQAQGAEEGRILTAAGASQVSGAPGDHTRATGLFCCFASSTVVASTRTTIGLDAPLNDAPVVSAAGKFFVIRITEFHPMPSRHTILVVDDEPDLVESVKDCLQFDYRVLGTTRAAEGLQIMEREAVHIVMTDQRMPEMTGVEFLRRLRDAYPDTVRLLFTAYSDLKTVTEAVNQGNVYRYLTKPWDDGELRSILKQAAEHYDLIAERKRLLRELHEKNRQLEETNAQLRKLTTQLMEVNAELLKSVRKDKRRLGNYQLLELLTKQGGMGRVYKALHILLLKVVALKTLPAERMCDTEAVARFRREMKAVGQVNHPNIVQASDAGQVEGTHFLVMEFVEGADLAKLIAHNGPLAVADACELVRQAANGLQHVHEHGLIHRDLKPSNLMLTPTGVVKVLDLGLAYWCDQQSSSERLTEIGRVIGTADYIAPEQAFGTHPISIKVDIYSLGCTFYHLLMGHPPFSGPEYERAINKFFAHAQTPVPPIRTFRPEVPEGVAVMLDRMLAKNPADRFSTPGEVAVALQPFAVGVNVCKLLPPTEPKLAGSPETESYDNQGA
jgi:CheY-like chemotaxis protein/tRNA A-37 threonylcarbamoyl transferase component Bud32